MNEESIIKRLVDLYVGDELPEDLASELERRASQSPELREDMRQMKLMVRLLQREAPPRYDDETNLRILMKLRALGLDEQPEEEKPNPFQYRLRMEG